MAKRPVFLAVDDQRHFVTVEVEFVYNPGFSSSQKQKNVIAVHNCFNEIFPSKKVLEISTKSLDDIGVLLSAFNLQKYLPCYEKSVCLESVFQGGKVFEKGGPYQDLYSASAKDAKMDERLKTSGKLKSFYFDGREYPLEPKTAFYDWLYITALYENPHLAEGILEYDAFTDIEFDPKRSINCQAKTAALFKSLFQKGLVYKGMDFDSFVNAVCYSKINN